MSNRIERALMGLLIGINGISIFGFSTFGLHPQLLARWTWAPPIFAASYAFFAKAQIVVSGLVLLISLARACRAQWLLSFAALYALSLTSELLGTTIGIPFGKYEYTPLLGAKLFDHVPFLIPLSWFFMAVPSYALTLQLLPQLKRSATRILAAAFLLLAWDLTLDPAMSLLTPFWRWETAGPYYGMPLLNLFGWFVTGLALMSVLELGNARRWIRALSPGFYRSFYAANLLLPFGMCAAAGLWLPVILTVALGIGFRLAQRHESWVGTSGSGREAPV